MKDLKLYSYFQFLISKYDFKGPYEYNPGRWSGSYYVKGDIIVDFEYDGAYIAMIRKTKKVFPEIETGKLNIMELDVNDYKYYEISKLDFKRKLWNSVNGDNFPDKSYWYYEKLITNNSEILDGSLYKFSSWYFLLKNLKIK